MMHLRHQNLIYPRQREFSERGETQRRMMGGCAAERRGNEGRVNRKQSDDKKMERNRESRSAENDPPYFQNNFS